MKNIYFIGIGGIGMSALARYFKFKGYEVSGYDRTPSPLTQKLEDEGIPVHFTDDIRKVPSDIDNTLVVYTPAIPPELKELVYVNEKGYKVIKRSRTLGEITNGQKCLAVSGTHGKTTTSTLTAHILTESGEGCSAFLGGISKNYGTNMLVSHNDTVVAEADEFDRSFHQLFPYIAVITAIDADHLDIYGDYAHVLEAFKIFASQVSGTLIIKKGLPISKEDTSARILTYHIDNAEADFHAKNIKLDTIGHYTFDLVYPGGIIKDIRPGALGRVNIENSIAAAAICIAYGIDNDSIKKAIGSFVGVERRMDVHINREDLTYIDDYAHHPEELDNAIGSIRCMFPGKRITAVFQPHLYTRTRDFAHQFAKVLSKVDKLILLDIYPARENPIPGVDSKMILDEVNSAEKTLVKKEDLVGTLLKEKPEILVTFGAGDIDRLVDNITNALK